MAEDVADVVAENGGTEVSYGEVNGNDSLGAPDDTSWVPTTDGSFTPPAVPKTETEGRAPEKVNTEALRKFSANMRELITPMRTIYDDFQGLEVPSGAFAHAYKLRDDVMGAGGGVDAVAAVPGTRAFIEKAINAATSVADQADAMATLYENTEDQNKLDSDKLHEALANAQTYVTSATTSS
jgi:hypothetical protein